jgi:hypothetical protein
LPLNFFTFALAYALNTATSKDTLRNSFYGLATVTVIPELAVGGISGGAFNRLSLWGMCDSRQLFRYLIHLVADFAGAVAGAVFAFLSTE